MSKTTKVNVPKSIVNEYAVSYNGDDPITYKIHDGHVTVANEHVDKFLGAVPGASVVEGSKPEAGTTGDGK